MKTLFRFLVLAGMVMSFHASVEAGPGHKERFMKRIMKQLDLTEEQKAQLKELKKKNKPLMQAARDKVKAAHDKLDAGFSSGASDAELTKMHNDVMLALNARGTQRFSGLLEIRNILTPEQKAEFDKLHAEKKEFRRAKKRERRRWMKDQNKEE